MPIGNPVDLVDPGTGRLVVNRVAPLADDLFAPDTRGLLDFGINFSQNWTSMAQTLRAGGLWRALVALGPPPGMTTQGLVAVQEAMEDMAEFRPEQAWLTTEAELTAILRAWLIPWAHEGGVDLDIAPDACPTSDVALIRYLRDYVIENRLRLWVPQPIFDGFFLYKSKRLIRYQLPIDRPDHEPYAAVDLLDDTGTTIRSGGRALFTLLAAGAHFVIIESATDLGGGNRLDPTFYSGFDLEYRRATLHSHYTGTYVSNVGRGLIYPNFVTTETAPTRDCPFILAFLFGRTASSGANTFFQLEGWPAVGLGGGARHMADYDLHQSTKWNISTYGASIYSEKRGLTVFLAPSSWNPNQILKERNARGGNPTIMAPYVGAGPKQRWLDTNLIRN